MEEVIDFDVWISQQQEKTIVQYYAVYDHETGRIKGIWPQGAVNDEQFCVPIELSLAESILSGTLNPSFCCVNPTTKTFTLLDSQELGLTKIDNLLYRILEKRQSNLKNYDIHITYHIKENQLIFQSSEEYGGTFKDSDNEIQKHQTIVWDSRLDFLITKFNDPNIIYEFLSFNMSEMIGKNKVFDNLDIPKKFSIYTNRVLKDCAMEII